MSKRAVTIYLASIAYFAIAMIPGSSWAGTYKAPPAEVLALPKFCWHQYMGNLKGPQYQISREYCGVGMNHYCPGLIELNRAMTSFGSKRVQHLTVAKGAILYTLRWMKPYPYCPIRAQVEASLREVDTLLRFAPGH